MAIQRSWDTNSDGKLFYDEPPHTYIACESCTDEDATVALRIKGQYEAYCKECAEEKMSHEPSCLIYICTCTRSGA